MKTLKTSAIVLFLIIGQITFAQAKSYKETVTENPTAEEDLKVVGDYLDALINNNMDKAASFIADSYVGTGPDYQETETKAEHIAGWKEAHKSRKNEKNDYISQTFRVIDGDLKGDWVSVWGTYTFTENDVTVNLPYQYTAMVDNGKIVQSVIYYNRLAVSTAMGYELTAKQN
ncbi:nuclear transport factor 2 family protein [Subsaximicrobium wynnwilliamsii]|uniref:Nuclear transport factor 2 family protein n=1 Tax=Subsaximicrobium wynnwilliamsii TaxID=291179 RepID=A0A5C6ZCD9_9FLAO|nr:nuclear transport factor 2 family protein [Subsaximicrobium wynnwilliamsii]TXD82052.1 nuclear transport factor 2 family protein [Subsaximicrobium wynnwilliamsii]TXD87254.1 nuclear transport factor 2 family protein [Subsaximicrobium wynnwilliamsii]TXE01512.1 nuclear transport factor 2 family protein [Subsaximicrobium wynnwilliamsii]